MPDLTDIKELATEAVVVIKQAHLGPGMKKLTVQRESAYVDYMNSGHAKDATVINFNPVSLKVEDGLIPWRVPAATDKLKKAIEVEHGGKRYVASYFTIKKENARFIPWIRDVHKPSDEGENPNAEYDAKFVTPLELIDQYKIQYSSHIFTPMGGVIAFEGDIHTFTKSKGTIRIPDSTRKPDGTRSYFSREVSLADQLSATLGMQKDYCGFMIGQGDEFDQDDTQRKNITDVHRLWMQFALDMGWKQNAPRWMNSKLDSDEACKTCGVPKTRTDAWACKCGTFYNPLAAFMAGQNVPEAFIYALQGKELETALGELGRRAKIRKQIEAAGGIVPPTPPKTPAL